MLTRLRYNFVSLLLPMDECGVLFRHTYNLSLSANAYVSGLLRKQ